MSAALSDPAATARRALSLLDLTDLSDACTASAVDALCRDARESGVAAVCVWPQYVSQCGRGLAGSPVRIATVVNFPAGGEDVERTLDDAREAVADGAHEIDLVLPYRAFLRGDEGVARDMVEAVRDICARTVLKVILETGALESPERIAAAGRLALSAGADFLKTSTGKSPVSATPQAAETLLGVLRGHEGRPAGLKVSGGLRTLADAATYLDLADKFMGPGWVSPRTFRLGASSLFSVLRDAAGAGA